MGLAHWSLVSPYCSFFLFFLFGLIPWSAGALWVHFSARASKTHSRRCPRWGIFRYSRGRLWPMWTVQVPCWGFIGFLRKPRNINLFLSSIFRTAKGQFSCQFQRKAMQKNVQTTAQLHSSPMLVKSCSKFSKPEDNVQKIRPLFMKWYAGRNLVSIKVNTDRMLSWLCIFHFA